MDPLPAYGLAYTMECIIAAATIAMGDPGVKLQSANKLGTL